MLKEQQMFEVIKLPFIWSTEQWFADLASSLPVTCAPVKEYRNSQLDYQHTGWLLNSVFCLRHSPTFSGGAENEPIPSTAEQKTLL